MPNYVHGIIPINKPDHNPDDTSQCDRNTFVEPPNGAAGFQGFPGCRVCHVYQSEPEPQPKNKFGPQSRNLGSILRGFKIDVKKGLKPVHPTFGWQGRFQNHIIRSEEEYHRITIYIRNNPVNWKGDSFYKNDCKETGMAIST